jgi:hypothetical protein
MNRSVIAINLNNNSTSNNVRRGYLEGGFNMYRYVSNIG